VKVYIIDYVFNYVSINFKKIIFYFFKMSSVELDDGKISLKYMKGNTEVIDVVDPNDDSNKVIRGIYTTTRNLVAHLIVSKGQWTKNVHTIVIPLVKELVEFAQGYKYLAGRNKKELVILLIREIITKELDSSDVDDVVRGLILMGVDATLEPAVDLAVFAASGKIRLNRKVNKLFMCCFDVE